MTTIRSIALTMRACVSPDTGEVRDAIAGDWPRFLGQALPEHRWLAVPNIGADSVALAQRWGLDALLLTGGDDWGAFPERDRTEETLFHWAMENRLPVIGICRGAQVMNRLLGGTLRAAGNRDHVAATHPVTFTDGSTDKVNSFHDNVIPENGLADALVPLARAEDGTVEAFAGADNPRLLGLMWHPEREQTAQERDRRLLKQVLECADA